MLAIVNKLLLWCCSGDTPVLYQVLPEKSSAVGGAMMGSSHVYDMAAVSEHCMCVYLLYYLLLM